MIDVSDGLVADAGHLAEDSDVRDRPAHGRLRDPRAAARRRRPRSASDPLQFILGGGDDHALLATFPPEVPLPGPAGS